MSATFSRALAAAAALLLPIPTMTQQVRPDARAAADVVRDAFAALDEQRWGDVAPLMHPEALQRFRAAQVAMARANQRHFTEPAAGPSAPGMPEEVARWFREQALRHAERTPPPLRREFGVATLAELEALPADEMFTRWLRARDPREGVRQAAEAAGKRVPEDPAAWAPLRERREVVGAVEEGDSTVHVVYRTGLGAPPADSGPGQLGVATVRRSPQGWRLWSAGRDHGFLGDDFVFSWTLDEEEAKRLAEASAAVVAWPAGRAFVAGYPGGVRPPRALVVEVQGPDGAPTRVEVPASAFEEMMERLLAPWTGLEPEPVQP